MYIYIHIEIYVLGYVYDNRYLVYELASSCFASGLRL